MKNFLPYKISHIFLDLQQNLLLPETNDQGNYIVFWWKEIALGDLFIEPGHLLSEEEYLEKLSGVIHNAIAFYCKHTDCLSDSWKESFINNRFEEWKNGLEIILSSYLHKRIPKMVPVSVIICTANKPEHLYKCLSLLTNLTCLPQEIIVVDSAPANNLTRQTIQQFKDIIYIEEPRKGLNVARNAGLKRASCPVVAYTDDDASVHDLWMYRVWESFENSTTAAMTGLVIASELNTKAQFIFEKHWSFNRGYIDKVYNHSFFQNTQPKAPPVWEIGAGANMAFRKSVLEDTGGFNEMLDVGAAGCNGDSEIWCKILSKGHEISYNPRAIVFQEHCKEIKGLKRQMYHYMRGHTTAALLQHGLYPETGQRQRVFKKFPGHYGALLVQGFPAYPHRYSTILNEIKGVMSGVAFYYKNRKHRKNQ